MVMVDRPFIDEFLDLANIAEDAPGIGGEILRQSVKTALTRPSSPIFLPARKNQITTWYVLPRTPQQERILRDQVRAFLSHPYSNFNGIRGNFDQDDPLDAHVLRTFGHLAFKITAVATGTMRPEALKEGRELFNKSLFRLIQLLDEQPGRSFELQRSLQRIRQDFEWSLRVGDAHASKKYLDEMTANGRLSQENVWYLQIQRWESLGHWDQIIGHPDLADLLYLRRPTSVTYAILRALNAVYFDGTRFSDDELRQFLLEEPLSGLSSIKIAVDSHTPQDVVAIYQNFQDLLKGMGSFSPTAVSSSRVDSPTKENFDVAEGCWRNGDFSGAIEVLRGCDDDVRKTVLLLRICRDAPNLSLVNEVMRARSLLTAEQMSELTARRETRDLLEWFDKQLINDEVPNSLSSWLSAFSSDTPESALEDIVRNHGDSWNSSNLSVDEVIHVSELIEGILDTPRKTLLLRTLPTIHRLVYELDVKIRIPLLRVMNLAIVLEEEPTTADLSALHMVSDELLENVASEERGQILSDLADVWSTVGNPRRFSWMLDVIASAKATASTQDATTLNVIHRMLAVVSGFFAGSLDEKLKSIAEHILMGISDVQIADDKWQTSTQEIAVARNPFEVLTGKSVGLYCLETQRARRLADVLQELGECSVTINGDPSGSRQLESLASNSDLMVVITSAAKHAATECIRANRGDKPTAYVHSTGVSTFSRCVADFLSENTV